MINFRLIDQSANCLNSCSSCCNTNLLSANIWHDLMMRFYLISVCYLGVRELSRHELKENNSIGIDIRLEAVRIVILHPNNLRCLWTNIRKKPHFYNSFVLLLY